LLAPPRATQVRIVLLLVAASCGSEYCIPDTSYILCNGGCNAGCGCQNFPYECQAGQCYISCDSFADASGGWAWWHTLLVVASIGAALCAFKCIVKCLCGKDIGDAPTENPQIVLVERK
jgi:hypothetical protein